MRPLSRLLRAAAPARGLRLAFGCVAAAALVCPFGVSAAPQPMTLAPFTDMTSKQPSAAADAPCRVRITSLADTRADPGVIGVYLRRAVLAPEDRPAWLRGIVRALASRGVTPLFDGDPAAQTAPLQASVVLEKAWVTNVLSDIAASAVFRVEEATPDGAMRSTLFRGTQQKMTYFGGGEGKIQHGIDSALSQALDAMADHFLATCREEATPQADPPG